MEQVSLCQVFRAAYGDSPALIRLVTTSGTIAEVSRQGGPTGTRNATPRKLVREPRVQRFTDGVKQ